MRNHGSTFPAAIASVPFVYTTGFSTANSKASAPYAGATFTPHAATFSSHNQ